MIASVQNVPKNLITDGFLYLTPQVPYKTRLPLSDSRMASSLSMNIAAENKIAYIVIK